MFRTQNRSPNVPASPPVVPRQTTLSWSDPHLRLDGEVDDAQDGPLLTSRTEPDITVNANHAPALLPTICRTIANLPFELSADWLPP